MGNPINISSLSTAMESISSPQGTKEKVYLKINEDKSFVVTAGKAGKLGAEEITQHALVVLKDPKGATTDQLEKIVKGLKTLKGRIEDNTKNRNFVLKFIINLFGKDRSKEVLGSIEQGILQGQKHLESAKQAALAQKKALLQSEETVLKQTIPTLKNEIKELKKSEKKWSNHELFTSSAKVEVKIIKKENNLKGIKQNIKKLEFDKKQIEEKLAGLKKEDKATIKELTKELKEISKKIEDAQKEQVKTLKKLTKLYSEKEPIEQKLKPIIKNLDIVRKQLADKEAELKKQEDRLIEVQKGLI